MLHRRDHTAGEAASTANVLIGIHLDMVITQRRGIQSTAIVHNMHMKMPGDIFLGIQDALLHQFNIFGDEGLLFKRCRCKSQFNRTGFFRYVQRIVSVANAHRSRSLQMERRQDHVFINVKREIDAFPFTRTGSLGADLIMQNRIGRQRVGFRLGHGAGRTLKFQVKMECRRCGAAHQFTCGKRIEIRGEIALPRLLEGPFAGFYILR